MTTHPPPPRDLLDQLEGYLSQDPGNEALLAQAFDAALRSGRLDRAHVHLHTATQAGHSPLAWGLRRAHWMMAKQDWSPARHQLQSLREAQDAPAELIAATRHDEATIALYENQALRGVELLAPLMAEHDVEGPTQTLWLRLLHRADRLDEALLTAQAWSKANVLAAEAMGVASLVAMDHGDLGTCRAWADQALMQGAASSEALVARASIALGDQDASRALDLLDRAMQRNPRDGRALSTQAFAHLLSGDMLQAEQTFTKALALMPGHVGTWHGLGWATLLQGKLPQAEAAFDAGLALDRNFAESHGGKAVVLAKRGDRAAAQECLQVALRLDAQSMAARYAQAILGGTDTDPEAMHRLAKRLLQGKGLARSD